VVVRGGFAPLTLTRRTPLRLLALNATARPTRRLAAIPLRRAAATLFVFVGHDTSISQKKRTSEMREGLLETE
jgi:hypothetical protein